MKIVAISDTHIRNLKYHKEYREVFDRLYSLVRKEKPDCIVHCGDLAHTKTQLSPEYFQLTSEFLDRLSDIADLYILLGNHDGNLKNSSRMDAVSPIVGNLKKKNIFLLKTSGERIVNEQLSLHALSVFDRDNWTLPSDPARINIALYHGSILNSKIDSGWGMQSADDDISIFDDYDFSILGDIHRTQALDKEGRIWYVGSTIQQNFGETDDKGFLVWDIKSKDDFNVRHVIIPNPKPFITTTLTRTGKLSKKFKCPPSARVRVLADEKVSLSDIRKAIDIINSKFKPESVIYFKRAIDGVGKNVNSATAKGVDLRDINIQKALIKNYLENYDVDPDQLEKVYDLNDKYNKIVEAEDDICRNIIWSLNSIEWSNTFNYGEANRIDFQKICGLVGIFGRNYSGKSSIIDTILYTIFNSISKNSRKNYNIINEHKNDCESRASILVGPDRYIVERSSEKYEKRLKGSVTNEAKTSVNFYKTTRTEIQELNSLTRNDTDKKIRSVFGTFEDFLLTSVLSQHDALSFINEGSTRRKEILARFLDLDFFDKKFKLAKDDSCFLKDSIKKSESGEILLEQLQNSKIDLDIFDSRLVKELESKKDLEEKKISLEAEEKIYLTKLSVAPKDIIELDEFEEKEKALCLLLGNDEEKLTIVRKQLEEKTTTLEKINSFFNDVFDIEKYKLIKENILEHQKELKSYEDRFEMLVAEKERKTKRIELLDQVPCGDSFPQCKFIKEAHLDKTRLQGVRGEMEEKDAQITLKKGQIGALEPDKVFSYIEKYQKLFERKTAILEDISNDKEWIVKLTNEMSKNSIELEKIRDVLEKSQRDKVLIMEVKNIKKKTALVQKNISSLKECLVSNNANILELNRSQASCEERIRMLSERIEEIEETREQYKTYELFLKCMGTRGISYDIIKERLPVINEEISSLLSNIVNFEIFFENEENSLNIFIKHQGHSPRFLEMGSGAEKTIAAIAIRLALIGVSSLPRADFFILDEPGTALDENNMEGFCKILEMIRSSFKTVLLISHLDSLKDVVDEQLTIEKKDGFAYINV